jgi:hypothetical protein
VPWKIVVPATFHSLLLPVFCGGALPVMRLVIEIGCEWHRKGGGRIISARHGNWPSGRCHCGNCVHIVTGLKNDSQAVTKLLVTAAL